MSNIVEIENAVKVYPRGAEEVRAIDGVTLEIKKGDFLSIVGPSGSGKTTLLNLIGCLDKPTSGRVSVHGMETEELTEKALATIRSTTIGFVFQQFFLMPTLTAVENVVLPSRFSGKRIRNPEARAIELLDSVGLSARADHYPSELSGGEMQRVALARALINEPDILLADEPTGNLASKGAEEISQILDELCATGLTIVVVTHNPELAANAVRSIDLKDGKIVEERELRPAPARTARAAAPVKAMAPPEYMPSTIKKRKLASTRVTTAFILLGIVMFAAAYMPVYAKQASQWTARSNVFTVSIYHGNGATRTYYGKPAFLFTGVWPALLGLLLVAAGIVFLVKRQRISGWSAIVIGSLGTILAGINLLMIDARLGPDPARGLLGTGPRYGSWVFLGVSLAALAMGVAVVVAYRSRAPAEDAGSS